MMLERYLGVLPSNLKAAGKEGDTGPGLSILNTKTHPSDILC